MATMGLRINQPAGGGSGTSTSLGAEFAKAMFGDPEMDIKLARLRAEQEMDQYQQRQIDSAIKFNEAKTRQQQLETDAALGAVDAGTTAIGAAQNGYAGEAPVAVEPAPVEPLALPETTNVLPMPNPLTAGPAPINIGPDTGDPRPAIVSDDRMPAVVEPVLTTEVAPITAVDGGPVPVDEGGPINAGAPTRTPYPVTPGAGEIKVEHVGPDQAVVTKDGKAITPVLTRAQAEAMSRRAAFSTDPAGQLGKYAGMGGILATPELTQGQKAATLYGTLPSRESVLGTDEAIRLAQADPGKVKDRIQIVDGIAYEVSSDATTGAIVLKEVPGQEEKVFAGKDSEGQRLRNMIHSFNQKLDGKQPLTPGERAAYASAYEELYGDKVSTSKLPDGRDQATVLRRAPPEMTRRPDQLDVLGPVPTAAAPEPPAPPDQQPVVQQPPDLVQPPPAVVQPPAPVVQQPQPVVPPAPAVKNYGGWGDTGAPEVQTTPLGGGGSVTRTVTGDIKNPVMTADVRDAYTFTSNAIPAMKMLDAIGPGEVPGIVQQSVMSLAENQGLDSQLIEYSLQDPEARSFARAMQIFINTQLRRESGAAVSPSEYARYKTMFIPKPGATARDVIETRMNRNRTILSLRRSLIGQVPPEQLQLLDEDMTKAGIDLEWTGQERPPAAAAPGTAPAAAGPGDFVVNPDGTVTKMPGRK